MLDCLSVHESVDDRAEVAARPIAVAHRQFRMGGMTEVPELHLLSRKDSSTRDAAAALD
ncbi:hypothetical protein [Streptomyces pinistramenti]|uniref:hypothetical protein n=1 Tax=Streptomyces pinistramenti TaxID=2884812 RepID=UPI001D07038B|nr:hypothetical protein [Streptomyces pinistramenti]MCB5908845.1 hypothetical protein [Streptomyces pinistramenti]